MVVGLAGDVAVMELLVDLSHVGQHLPDHASIVRVLALIGVLHHVVGVVVEAWGATPSPVRGPPVVAGGGGTQVVQEYHVVPGVLLGTHGVVVQ